MPNDAKFGLLAGVIGVIVVAVMSMNHPAGPNPGVDTNGLPSAPSATAAPKSANPADEPKGDGKPESSVASTPARSTEPPTTPVVRTRKEPDGTPARRTPMDDIDP